MTFPFSEHTRRVLERSAVKMSYVEPEHVLLGLLTQTESKAGELLLRAGIKLDDIGRRLLGLYRGGE